ncbi:MAG: M61 family peptidase [Acidobacteria bacterium]|nr:M61 family peptidase [Acidobacteriota bacterium]
MTNPVRRALRLAAAVFAFASARAIPAAGTTTIRLEVDAREAPRKIFHARLTIPAAPGPLTLLYPKWIPGEHGPTGPIADVGGFRIAAGGTPVPWTRDPVEMYAVRCEVPAGASEVEVGLDFLSPASTGQFSSGSSATDALALVSWNQVLVYPKGPQADSLLYAASLRLPSGWSHATALAEEGGGGDLIHFAPVSLTTLVDSPVLAGKYFRVVPLSDSAPAHRLDIAADSQAALEMTAHTLRALKNLVAETGALFGSRPYAHYDFLLTLSDSVAHFGLEHHQSSDNRVAERSLVDEDKRKANLRDLLPHEMVHSWNGKFRRPAGLMPGRFDEPMRGELLWVYEGLTQYLGEILSARTGNVTPEQYREILAITAADMEATRGRSWRPLSDTAMAAQVLYGARSDWASWRRGVDFYPESSLLWLEADTIIRRETRGKKSLDDFCRLFYGGRNGAPAVEPYTAEDLFASLHRVAAWDWKKFWTDRLQSTSPHAPVNGILASGWKLAWVDTPSEMQKAREESGKITDVRYSLGFAVGEDGAIPDIIPDSPAARAGIGPGMRLVAVNGRHWSRESLRDAIRGSLRTPVELLVENGEFYRTHRLEYSGGERYPRLEREAGRPDVLTAIVRPLIPSPAVK